MNLDVSMIIATSIPVILIIIGFIINKGFDTLLNSGIINDKPMLMKSLTAFQECADIVVRSLNQTVVDSLKKKNEDGKLTEEEAKEVLAEACAKLDSLIAEDVKAAIKSVYADYDQFLVLCIERAVDSAKSEKVNDAIKKVIQNLKKSMK